MSLQVVEILLPTRYCMKTIVKQDIGSQALHLQRTESYMYSKEAGGEIWQKRIFLLVKIKG